jgi:hypothetical protein
MSHNLHLRASRDLFTKSGKFVLQTEEISLWQTPTLVTSNILSCPTFEEQLQTYCKWAESLDVPAKPEMWIEAEIYDTEIRPKECYMSFDLENEKLKAVGFPTDTWDEYEIVKVALKGEPEFEEVFKKALRPFVHHSVEQKHLGVGYRWLTHKPHYRWLQTEVQKLTAEEFKLEFYSD